MITRRRLLVALGLWLASQLYPVARTNPLSGNEIEAPPAVAGILRAACYDCHSNRTRWPWYAYVAPVSWLVAHDVGEARNHLNFSTWGDQAVERRREKRHDIGEEIEEGGMPLGRYRLLHRAARLTAAQRELLVSWSGRGADSPRQ